MNNNDNNKIIRVDYLARVEGEGALFIKIDNQQVSDVQLKIFEPPRFFEAFLRGRQFTEAPDITARICGICPIAYQMGAVHAMEDILGVQITGPLRELRRLIYCGEWIESHGLHIYMLHAPDFLGYQDAIAMARDYPDIVKRGLRLKKLGNEILRIVGGREIHPVNVCLGGFYKTPKKKLLVQTLRDEILWARDAAMETVHWVSSFEFPDFTKDYEYVSLVHPEEYPLNEGRLCSNRGLDIDIREFNDYFSEEHVAHSNALHCVHNERGAYYVGPMARYNLNYNKLSPMAKEVAQETLGDSCHNPFKSIIVRSIEVLYACEEALRIIDNYEEPEHPSVEIIPKAGKGHGCTEAPRGICYHSYEIDDSGKILEAQIVPPTSQNQKTIEDDLRQFVPGMLNLSDEDLTWKCEQAVRNYDPCISCATHFLKLHIERS